MKILIIYYSMYGNTFELAKAIGEGAKEIEGATVDLRQVPDLLPESVVNSNDRIKAAKDLQKSVPVAKVADLPMYDAIIWGTPTRYGNMCAQMKNFMDQTGFLWTKGELENKIAGVFTSTSSIHGGQETTLTSTMVCLMHLGMIIAGVPYSVPELLTTESGGTPYGPSHVAGAKSDQPITDQERKIAIAFGKRIAKLALKNIVA